MRYPAHPLPFSSPSRALPPSGAIEWEELPSLADTLAERLVVLGTRHRHALEAARARASAFERAGSGQAWDSTRPADFDTTPAPRPFREPLDGLAIRETDEPDVFRHFFGVARSVNATQR